MPRSILITGAGSGFGLMTAQNGRPPAPARRDAGLEAAAPGTGP